MIDIKELRENPDRVRENIKKKFQDEKLPLVDEIIELDKKSREANLKGDTLRAERNSKSQEIGNLMKAGKKDEAMKIKEEVSKINEELAEIEKQEEEYSEEVKIRMMKIPNFIDDSVPLGKDDSENVDVQHFGDNVVPDYEIPYHTDIIERLGGIDLDAARKVAGNGFYYLIGDVAR